MKRCWEPEKVTSVQAAMSMKEYRQRLAELAKSYTVTSASSIHLNPLRPVTRGQCLRQLRQEGPVPMDKGKSYKIALYIRVSTEEQAESPEGSIKNQEDRLRKVVAAKIEEGTTAEIVGVYVDPGFSGKDTHRPQLQNMLTAIRRGEVNLAMVTELSRLSRNTKDRSEMWEFFHEHKCEFHSLRERFDTTSAAGEMMLHVMMTMAQFERRQTSERIAASFRARAERGLYNGGSVPLGYRLPDIPSSGGNPV